MSFDRERLIDDLTVDEGENSGVYDDETGKPIAPGSRVEGNPTTAIGHALNKTPWTQAQMRTICGWDIGAKTRLLYDELPWIAGLPEPAQRALANMAFNLGVDGLKTFSNFLLLLQQGHVEAAISDLEGTLWAKEVGPDRTSRIVALIRGVGP